MGKIKQLFNQYIRQVTPIKELSDYITILKSENTNLKIQEAKFDQFKNLFTAEIVIAKIIDRGINWYDWKELDTGKQKAYEQGALTILRSEVFNNEIKHTVSDIVQEIAKNAKSWEEIMALRMTINGLELLKERLETISLVENEQTKDNLESVI